MTTPEGIHFENNDSVRKDQGYDKPYDPSRLTADQALQLQSQGIGGQDINRIANRAKDTAFFDKDQGQPEGTHDVVKSPEDALAATHRWKSNNDGVMEGIQALLDEALERNDVMAAAKLRANLERRQKIGMQIADRINRLSDEDSQR